MHGESRGLVTICITSLLFVFSARICAAQYSIQDLGLIGGNFSYAYSLNSSGQAVGAAEISTLEHLHAAFFTGGAAYDLGVLGGPNTISQSIAFSINDAGLIVGESDTTGNRVDHAFLYNAGTMLDLGTLGGSFSTARGINNNNQVVGYSTTRPPNSPDPGETRPFLCSSGTMTPLGSLGGTGGGALAINDSGLIVGQSNTAAGIAHAASFFGDTITDLYPVSNRASAAYAVNSSGTIVGTAEGTGGSTKAVIFSAAGTIDLGSLGGGTASWARGINDAGVIVGSSIMSNHDEHAFIFDQGVMIDLNTLIPPGSGWTLFSAYDINNSGLITGYGWSPSGYGHAFLLTPIPEPAVPLLLVLAIAFPCTRRSRHHG
jgi:probable HAF family extracellular repeat protein